MSPKRISLTALGVVTLHGGRSPFVRFFGVGTAAGVQGQDDLERLSQDALNARAMAIFKAECADCHGGAHPRCSSVSSPRNCPHP